MVKPSKRAESQLPVLVGPCDSLEELHELARHEHPFLDLRTSEVMLSDYRDAPIVWLASHPEVSGVVLVIDSEPRVERSSRNLPGLCQPIFCIVFDNVEAAKETLSPESLPTKRSFARGGKRVNIEHSWETPGPARNERFSVAVRVPALDSTPDVERISAYLANLALLSGE